MEEKKQVEEKNKTDSPKIEKNSAKKVAIDAQKPKRKGMKIQSWIYLLLIDFIILGVSFYLISVLPKKAGDLNKARSDEQRVIESKKVDVSGLEYAPTKEAVEKLSLYFPEETGYIGFIERLEVMRNDSLIKNFSIIGDNAIKDKTGAYGLPFIVEIEGNWDSINNSLREVQQMPYLMRAINIDARTVGENMINFKYGGFLYVSDKLAKTR